jgi:hypothetical protein
MKCIYKYFQASEAKKDKKAERKSKSRTLFCSLRFTFNNARKVERRKEKDSL